MIATSGKPLVRMIYVNYVNQKHCCNTISLLISNLKKIINIATPFQYQTIGYKHYLFLMK